MKKIASGIPLDNIAKQIYDSLKHKRDWEKNAEKALKSSLHLTQDKIDEVMDLLRSEKYFDTGEYKFSNRISLLATEIITAASRSRSQKGDISQSLADQGFFDGGAKPKGLERDPQLSGGNPVDVKKKFFEQNPK